MTTKTKRVKSTRTATMTVRVHPAVKTFVTRTAKAQKVSQAYIVDTILANARKTTTA